MPILKKEVPPGSEDPRGTTLCAPALPGALSGSVDCVVPVPHLVLVVPLALAPDGDHATTELPGEPPGVAVYMPEDEHVRAVPTRRLDPDFSARVGDKKSGHLLVIGKGVSVHVNGILADDIVDACYHVDDPFINMATHFFYDGNVFIGAVLLCGIPAPL